MEVFYIMDEKQSFIDKLKSLFFGETNTDEWIKYNDFPDVIREKIVKTLGMFVGLGLLICLCSITMGASLIYCGIIFIIAGVVFALDVYYNCAANKMVEVEGVVVGVEREGYRKQRTYLLVMTENKTFFKVLITEKKHFYYKVSDIVRFYTNIRSIDENFEDGIYTIRTLYTIERLKMDTEAENDPAVKKALENLKAMHEENE